MKAIPIQSDAKKRTVDFKLGDEVYPLCLSLNCIEELQKEFSTIDKAMEDIENLSTLKKIIAILVNDAVEEHNDECEDEWEYVTPRQVGRRILSEDIPFIVPTIMECFGISLPDSEESEGEVSEEMNAMLDGLPDIDTEKNSQAEPQSP